MNTNRYRLGLRANAGMAAAFTFAAPVTGEWDLLLAAAIQAVAALAAALGIRFEAKRQAAAGGWSAVQAQEAVEVAADAAGDAARMLDLSLPTARAIRAAVREELTIRLGLGTPGITVVGNTIHDDGAVARRIA